MLSAVIEFSLNNRYLVLSIALILVFFGIVALWQLPFDAFPDTTPTMVQVNVSAPGWSTEDLELLVTFPIEQSLTGLASLKELRSVTKYGICQVNAIFEDDIDVYLARQQVSEKLISVPLPEGIEAPVLSPVSTGLGEIFHYLVLSESDDITHARTIQDWIIKPQLMSVPGVAEVNSWGGFVRQYQILFSPLLLSRYNLTIEEVAGTLEDELGNVPGGQINRGGEMTILRGIGIVESVEEIENLVVDVREDVPIYVKDIGQVVISHENRRGATTYNGQGEVVLGLGFMITGENPARVTRDLSDRLESAKKNLPENSTAFSVYERTDMVSEVLSTVEHNLVYGALLVIVVLFVFLGNIRAGLIVASAIPLSMMFAFNMMTKAGIVGSLMSLGAIDFGLAVDNAVIQVENTVRRLSQSDKSINRLQIIKDAILEVRKPTLFGELIIIIVYLPILTLQGIEGKLFRPMALTVVFVLTGSLILSFTVLPALISVFLKRKTQHKEPVFVNWIRGIYRPLLNSAIKYSRIVIISAVLIIIGGVILFNNLGSEFVPRLSEGTIVINFVRLAGISLDQSIEYNTLIEKNLLEKFPDEIDFIWTRTGTAELSTDPMGLELSDMFISLKPRNTWTKAKTQQELVNAIDTELADLPGQNRIFTQPIEMRVNEMVAGIRSDIGIKLFGDDLVVLEDKAEEIMTLVEQIDGSSDVTIEQLTGQPQMRIAVDRQKLARFGLTAREVLSAIESMGGIVIGDVFEGQKRFDLALRIDTTRINSVEDVNKVLIRSSSGSMIGLDRVTDLSLAEGPATITREWSKRRIVVQCNVRDRDIGSFVSELRHKLANNLTLPKDYFIRLGGQFEHLERARMRLVIVVPLSLILIFGLLYWTYKSARDAILIFAGVPIAAVGGAVSLALRDMPFSISAGVGFIALSGIAVLNGLVLVSSIKRFRFQGMEITAAIKESAVTRLRPVMMTALVAAFGFIPMAVSTGVGAEVQRPLATVVVGGILTSSALTLVVLPSLYNVFGKRTKSET
jgi:cobalt-zinc-cadmium resistance protein CzcA